MWNDNVSAAPRDRQVLMRFSAASGLTGYQLVEHDPDNPKGNEWRVPNLNAWFGVDNFDAWIDPATFQH